MMNRREFAGSSAQGSVRRAVALLLSLLPLGCDEALSPVELIDKTRVVAMRVEVEGDATRAAPLPGESVDVRLLVLSPELDPELAFTMRSCIATDSRLDATRCSSETLAMASSLEPVIATPALSFSAPSDATGDERLAVFATVCPAGQSLPSEDARRCSDGSEVLSATLDFAMDDGSHPNSNPEFTDVFLDGVPLPAESATTTDCAALTSVTRGSKHTLRVELTESSRDPLAAETGADTTRESLLVSYFIDQGDLDHAFSSIPSTLPVASGSAVWTAPERVGDTARLVRFAVVARDGRGGSDFVERRVCVAP
jgi:hypothetical protein